jgi:hypothetical protein
LARKVIIICLRIFKIYLNKIFFNSNHPFLELSDVFIRITNNIKVTVIPFYIGVKEEQRKKLYWVKKDYFCTRKKLLFLKYI